MIDEERKLIEGLKKEIAEIKAHPWVDPEVQSCEEQRLETLVKLIAMVDKYIGQTIKQRVMLVELLAPCEFILKKTQHILDIGYNDSVVLSVNYTIVHLLNMSETYSTVGELRELLKAVKKAKELL